MASRASSPAMASRVPGSAMASRASSPAKAPRASSPAMAPRVPRPALEASPESLPITSLQGAHPPSPVLLLRRGTRLPGGGGNVTSLSVLHCLLSHARLHLVSLEPWLRAPAPHHQSHQAQLISTHLSLSSCPISYVRRGLSVFVQI